MNATILKRSLVLAYLIISPLSGATQEGTDTDGDVYQVQLIGAGSIVSTSLSDMQVSDTNAATLLTITVTQTIGDGQVNVAGLTTGGFNLGTLRIKGDLGDFDGGSLGTLDVQSIGAATTACTLDINGSLGRLTCPYGIHNAVMTIGGHVSSFTVGRRTDTSGVIRKSEILISGNLSQLTLNQSLTAESIFDVAGNLNIANIYGDVAASTLSVQGNVSMLSISGGMSAGGELEVTGDLGQLNITKSVNNTQITIGGKLTSARFNNDLDGVTFYAAEVDRLTVSDDLTNSTLRIIGDVDAITAGDVSGLTLAVSGRLDRLTINRDLYNSTIAALVGVGRVMVMRDINRTTLIAGIDLGDNLVRDTDDTVDGNADIDSLFVLGDMVDSNIAAGVDAGGPAFQYGDGDDFAVNNHTGTSRIYRIMVIGQIRSTQLTDETYALTADDGIDVLLAAGRAFTGAPGIIVQEF